MGSKIMPSLKIQASKSSYKNTGGICGMWDDNMSQELYVFDKDGLFEYTSDVSKVRDFWQ